MTRREEAAYSAATQDFRSSGDFCGCQDKITIGEEDLASEVDEPPDEKPRFPRLSVPQNQNTHFENGYMKMSPQQRPGKASLLTQALLVSPDLTPPSDAEAPLLTSDGGLTSPTRTNSPSPPLPTNSAVQIAYFSPKEAMSDVNVLFTPQQENIKEKVTDKAAEKTVEAGLGRRRCITFACGGKSPTSSKSNHAPVDKQPEIIKPSYPPKRPCMLRFVCPTKPSAEVVRKNENEIQPLGRLDTSLHIPPQEEIPSNSAVQKQHDLESIIQKHSSPSTVPSGGPSTDVYGKPLGLGPLNLELSEATRFHEFAGSFDIDDEWIHKQTTHGQKITVNDTLRKENAIRRIAEEAEAEVLDEEAEEEDARELDESYNNVDHYDSSDLDSNERTSDGGNETDDEEGFADSDDDSDHGSQYQFWTTGLTTAATSTDHIEHIRPVAQRVASISSIESIINTHERTISQDNLKRRGRKDSQPSNPPKMRPCTPDLPDSTDFVCGTLDEDRPLEAAYMSCLEERRRLRHKIIPQDIDPSFPTSDLDEEDDDDVDDFASEASEGPIWVMGQPDNSDEEKPVARMKNINKRAGKSPMPSPKRRQRSPHPPKRNLAYRSPPPQHPSRHSPIHPVPITVTTQRFCSPPPMYRTSINVPQQPKDQGMVISHLDQRPHLTHTTSLPRTPNPFWHQHRESHFGGLDEAHPEPASPGPLGRHCRDQHSRGPINIVKGLENKRQWRKEKCWRHQNRHASKEKERRCQPGKGAERMKELGLEMAGRAKGGCIQRPKLVFSI